MPKRTGNRHSAKSHIYSPATPSEFADLPTPVVSPPPLPPPEVPALVEFSPDPEPAPQLEHPHRQLEPTIILTEEGHHGGDDDDPFVIASPPLLGNTDDPPLSPLLLQESEPPDDVLNFDQVEEPPPPQQQQQQQHHAVPTGVISGHTRSPVLAREPTMLENFSRAVRNYVPTSIPIPTAAPSPPRVSRPVSFGGFMTGPTATRMPTGSSGGAGGSAEVHEYGYGGRGGGSSSSTRHGDYDYPIVANRKNGEHDYGRVPWAREHYRGLQQQQQEEDERWRAGRGGAVDEMPASFASRAYSPQYDAGDDVFWARWDVLGRGASSAQQRRLLFLGYAAGMQIWDCTDLAMVSEVLNLSGSDWGFISFASLIPRPHFADGEFDPVAADRPVIGVIATIRDESTFFVYSLHRHYVVRRLPLPGLAVFTSNQQFIVISTINPPTLHILSSVTFATLYTISSASLVSNLRTSHVIVSPSEIETEQTYHGPWRAPLGEPIYALSGRLLAYASSPPHSASSAAAASSRQPQTQAQTRNQSPSGRFGMNITQADISNVAIKVGGTVLSGMKSLGEKAYSAALLRAGLAMESMSGGGVSAKGIPGSRADDAGIARLAGVGRFFSRSAPAAANDHHERRYPSSPHHSNPDLEHEHQQAEDKNESGSLLAQDGQPADVVAPSASAAASSHHGHHVTVLDLEPLLSGSGGPVKASPRKVGEFVTSKSKAVGGISFSGDGNSILVLPKDGQVSKVFQLRPRPTVFKSSAVREREGRTGVESGDSSVRRDAPWHLYDLRRGRTNAVIEGADWAEDGRWIAIGTRKRTVHVFAVNPYGGKPDQQSHVEGKVRNYTQLQPLSTEVQPVVRLRCPITPAQQKPRGPLAFMFIKSTDSPLPDTLLPPPTVSSPADVLGPSSLPKSDAGSSEPTSPRRYQRPTNFQDILVFDPADGMLSLRRIFVELRPRDQRISVPASVPVLGATSISLPGSGGAGRLSTPSPTIMNAKAVGNVSSHVPNADANMELVGKESVVATWSLQRYKDWREIKRVLEEPVAGTSAGRVRTSKNDVLAHAELSTSSTSPRVLPRSIYLSHQFSFHTLGEDYHALIRRYQFDIGGSEIEVRKKVQVSAYGAGAGESFLEGFSARRDIHRAGSSSFDEPLASALSAELDHDPGTSAAVLPMLPNGTPGSKPISFKSAIPIRKMAELSDGMTEGIGRIRREIHKARSPPSGSAARRVAAAQAASGSGGSVPLEFDDEDDDFMGYDGGGSSRTASRGGGGGGGDSGPTPSGEFMRLDAEYEADDLWQGWDPEDKQAIEDAERFDHISAVGFLDEEHASMVQAEKKRSRRRGT